MERPENPQSAPQSPESPTPQPDDVTLTLFDALQATKSSPRQSKNAVQNSIEIVGESTSLGRGSFSISPRLVIALGVTLLLTFVLWKSSRPSAPASVDTASSRSVAPARAPSLPRSLPRSSPQAATPPPARSWNRVPTVPSNTSSGLSDRDRERERDREYEREREREKRRQEEAWGGNSGVVQPSTRGGASPVRATEDPALIDGARGYKNPDAVLREREREELEREN